MPSKIFFSGEKYKYWECTMGEQSCTIIMSMDPQKTELELQQIENEVRKSDAELEDLINQRNEIDKKDTAKLSEIQNKILTAENKRRTEYSKGRKLEEQYNIYERYSRITYDISRLKDRYSREESIRIQIKNDDKYDGIIMTDISRLDVDIVKLEKFGISLNASYVDELVKIIKNKYFYITAEEREYIDNGVPEEVVKEFVSMCCQRMSSNIKDAKDKDYYDVKTTDLGSWYKETPFQRYTLREIKEAMIIYGYMGAPNKGRLDNTIDGQKVVRFIKSKIDSMFKEEENKK